MTGELTCDCLIIGGGPAGCALASILARWGRSVVLVDDGRKKHAIPAETLVPTAARRIEECGFASVFAEHEFFGVPRQGVIWDGDEPAWRADDERARGFKVERGVFDRALRAHVRSLGATVFDQHRVQHRLPREGHGTVLVTAHDGPGIAIEARSIVIAAGRGQHRALLDAEIECTGPATTTLSFTGDTEPPMGDATLVEAIGEGWLWWIPLQSGECCVAAMLDTEELTERGHDDLLRSAFDGALGARLHTDLSTPSFGANGTPRLLRAQSPVFLCGDAASVVDALSSQGVEKAMSSAVETAHAIETVLERPELGDAVHRHRQTWERRLWRAHAREASGWYARESRFPDRQFWLRRRQTDARSPLTPDAVVEAHPELEPRDALRRCDRGFERIQGIGVRGEDTSVANVGAVPASSLLALVDTPRSVAAVLEGAARDPDLFPLRPREVVDALELLVDDGLVIRG